MVGVADRGLGAWLGAGVPQGHELHGTNETLQTMLMKCPGAARLRRAVSRRRRPLCRVALPVDSPKRLPGRRGPGGRSPRTQRLEDGGVSVVVR